MIAKPLCVLVDDDQDFLTMAHRFFSRFCPEFDVMEFLSGLDALDYLQGHHADLVITDFRMPHFDGLRLTSAVRSLDPCVPILVMSGDAVGPEALARGASGFLPKLALPFELGSALERIGIHAHV